MIRIFNVSFLIAIILCMSLVIAGDNTMKLWDIRQFSKPINVVEDLTNVFSV